MDGFERRRKARRPHVEANLRLTLPALKAAGLLAGMGSKGVVEWSARARIVGDLSVETVLDGDLSGCLILTYAVNCAPRQQDIKLEPVPQQFGGVRWWAICPVSGARVGTLVFSQKHMSFVSVRAAGMAYSSQSEGVFKRIERRRRKVERRIEGLSKYARSPTRRLLQLEHRRTHYLWAKAYLASENAEPVKSTLAI